jgi:endonuclease/exonuclease/phosphatase family metal-dependent hydrolase
MNKILFLSIFISLKVFSGTLEVMSYNVENLFDAKHDVVNGKDKEDWAFLPKDNPLKKEACTKETSKHRRKECQESNWTEEKLEVKLSQITDVVKAANSNLPDFLGLVEVENAEVVSRLAKKLGYENFEITESPDQRGIDVALLFKNNKAVKKISRVEHVVPVDFPTRNILEVEFLINDKFPLTIFVNHWPSLHNPDSWRVKAAEVLVARTKEILLKNPEQSILVMGDFNTIDENDPHPFKTVLFKDNLYSDVASLVDESVKKKMPLGTYYFAPKDQWNFLDHFFMNAKLQDGKDLEVNLKTFEIFSPSFMQKEIKKKVKNGEDKSIKIVMAPKNFEPDASTKAMMGYSDHYPILLKLDYPETKKLVPKNRNTRHRKL